MAPDPGDVVPGSKVEQAKARSNHLRATIAEELSDSALPFSTDTGLALKFHGTYTQDDRDTRTQRRKDGLKPDSFHMVRTGIPGGVLSAEQYLVMDKLADTVGNGTLRVTTRQDIQFHRVYKTDLYELINLLNGALVTTLAACGDVVRNTTACPAPLPDPVRTELRDWATRISAHFKPKSRAYYDIWVDGEHAVSAGAKTIESNSEDPARRGTDEDAGSSGSDEVEPLYGQVYLPRKFKIGFSAPGDNCTDVLINDLAVIPVVEGETITAFTLFIGGGQGKTHNKPETYPRLATPLTTVPPEELFATAEAVIKLHRDYGDRNNREHARLKYVIDDLGDERVREIIAQNLGVAQLREADPVVLDHADDHLGWHPQEGGGWFLGVKVMNGRIADVDDNHVRTGLRAVVERFGASVRFTAREDVLLCDISDSDRALVNELLAEHGVRPAEQWVPVALNSFACPSLPTCGLALAESERFIPTVLDRLHEALDQRGLGDLEVHVRMTGCPNGCSRPYTTEVAFVGRGKNRYDVHLGGEQVGVRLNEIFCENVPGGSLVDVLVPVFERYSEQRGDGQGFGDWCHQVSVAKLRAELGTEEWVRTPRS
ncbi:MAG: NADPH-dependent assimilatory sulfite reductase hemoprotein subunit [Microthrixaceae bacterium]